MWGIVAGQGGWISMERRLQGLSRQSPGSSTAWGLRRREAGTRCVSVPSVSQLLF